MNNRLTQITFGMVIIIQNEFKQQGCLTLQIYNLHSSLSRAYISTVLKPRVENHIIYIQHESSWSAFLDFGNIEMYPSK